MDDKEYKKQWYEKNKERIKERKKKTTKQWYENGGKEWYREYNRKYYSDPEKRRMKNERRKKWRNKPENKEREKILRKKRYDKEKQHDIYRRGMSKPEIRKNRQENNRRWFKKNKERRKLYSKEYRSNPITRKKTRERELKRKYNITIADEKEMYNNQNGKCAICNYKFKEYDSGSSCNNFMVDHCHTTGKIRGLLCGNCNRGIGLLLENKKTIKNIIIYLGSNGIQ